MAHSIQEQARRIAVQNIARFQERLKTETDICERKMLEGLIVLERIKFEQRPAY